MTIRIGLIGYSDGNGHPYSFGSIINGFFPDNFDSEWSLIANYLSKKPSTDYLSNLAKVTKVWTPSISRTLSIATSCNISQVCSHYSEMDDVDAIVIARDDWQQRNSILNYFLEKSIPCFCDKPLTANSTHFAYYKNFILEGLLYTGSGFRHALELDPHRDNLSNSPFVTSYIVNDLEKYGIHMLDAYFATKDSSPISAAIHGKDTKYPIYELTFEDGSIFRLTTSPFLAKTFAMNYHYNDGFTTISIKDNFTAFRRVLASFLHMVQTGHNRDSSCTIRSLNALCLLSSLS